MPQTAKAWEQGEGHAFSCKRLLLGVVCALLLALLLGGGLTAVLLTAQHEQTLRLDRDLNGDLKDGLLRMARTLHEVMRPAELLAAAVPLDPSPALLTNPALAHSLGTWMKEKLASNTVISQLVLLHGGRTVMMYTPSLGAGSTTAGVLTTVDDWEGARGAAAEQLGSQQQFGNGLAPSTRENALLWQLDTLHPGALLPASVLDDTLYGMMTGNVAQPNAFNVGKAVDAPLALLLPVFARAAGPGDTWGWTVNASATECLTGALPCYHPDTGMKWWGQVLVLLNRTALFDAAFASLNARDKQQAGYQLTSSKRYGPTDAYHASEVLASNPAYSHCQSPVIDAVYQLDDDTQWGLSMCVAEGWQVAWRTPLLVAVVLASLLLVLTGGWALDRLMTRSRLPGMSSLEPHMATEARRSTFELAPAGSPAERLIALLSLLLEGHKPAMQDVVQLLSALQQRQDLYMPQHVEHLVQQAAGMDLEVAAALLSALAPPQGPRVVANLSAPDRHTTPTSAPLSLANSHVAMMMQSSLSSGPAVFGTTQGEDGACDGAGALCRLPTNDPLSPASVADSSVLVAGLLSTRLTGSLTPLCPVPAQAIPDFTDLYDALGSIIRLPVQQQQQQQQQLRQQQQPHVGQEGLPAQPLQQRRRQEGLLAQQPEEEEAEGVARQMDAELQEMGQEEEGEAGERCEQEGQQEELLHALAVLADVDLDAEEGVTSSHHVLLALQSSSPTPLPPTPSSRHTSLSLAFLPVHPEELLSSCGPASLGPLGTSFGHHPTASAGFGGQGGFGGQFSHGSGRRGSLRSSLSLGGYRKSVALLPATPETGAETAAVTAGQLRLSGDGIKPQPSSGRASCAMLVECGDGGSFSAPCHLLKPLSLLDRLEEVLGSAERLDTGFSAWELAEASNGCPLAALGYWVFVQSGVLREFNIHGKTLVNFLRQMEAGYRQDNPYHNNTHAADVLQSVHAMLHHGGLHGAYADAFTVMACYLAAVMHDYEHRGVTNDYLVTTRHPLALRYNDRSPHENHHVAAACRVLAQPEFNFLAHLPAGEWVRLRKLVIDLVLATDMKQHFTLVGHFSSLHRLGSNPLATVPASAAPATTSAATATATATPAPATAVASPIKTSGPPATPQLGHSHPGTSSAMALPAATAPLASRLKGLSSSLGKFGSFSASSAKRSGLGLAADVETGAGSVPAAPMRHQRALQLQATERISPALPGIRPETYLKRRVQSNLALKDMVVTTPLDALDTCPSAGPHPKAYPSATLNPSTSFKPGLPPSLLLPAACSLPSTAVSSPAGVGLHHAQSNPVTNLGPDSQGAKAAAAAMAVTAGSQELMSGPVAAPTPLDDAEQLLSLQIMLKCCDLGHVSAPLPVHLKWVSALEEEFFRQGDREKAMGMPPSPLCDRAGQGVAKSQVGFLDVVVLPLLTALTTRFPATRPVLEGARANYQYWKLVAANGSRQS